jgi:uncharacterized repeat protein (TIGR03847 family)
MSASFQLDTVDRFVVGTIGMPGERSFFFQVAAPRVILTFKCEKVQVMALVEALTKLLEDLPSSEDEPAAWASLDLPVLPEWAVGSIGIGYEGSSDRLVIVFEEMAIGTEEETSEARFFLTRAQAAMFVARATDIVSAGRPSCVLCANPIDADGYTCNCYN